MRERTPSQTALFVAAARALANDGFTTVPGFSDPISRGLLTPAWEAFYRAVSRFGRHASPERRARAMARLDFVATRVATIDAEIAHAVGSGCRQLVILGAGLDARAFRMRGLADVAVFEVDHPATQAYKRRRIASVPVVARSLAFVSVDFERQRLGGALHDAGFRPDVPTVWVWEGVVMYLTDQAVRQTLEDVAACSAPGSVLVANYHVPHGPVVGLGRRASRLLLALWREPHIGQRPREVMHAELRRAGLEVARDTAPAEWAERLGGKPPSGLTARVSRMVVARRSATP